MKCNAKSLAAGVMGLAVTAAPTFATQTSAAGTGQGCVGSTVSEAAHIVGGIGKLNQVGVNPGQVIQTYATAACGKHGG